jgi:hypothetical protein
MIERIEALIEKANETEPAEWMVDAQLRELAPLMLAYIEASESGDRDCADTWQALEDYCAEHLPEREEA